MEGSSKENNQTLLKESTAQWVNRTFVGNVTTNQPFQEVPSQSLDTTTIVKQENLKKKN